MEDRTIMNIHKIMNEFDQEFGHKRLKIVPHGVNGHSIYLAAIYGTGLTYDDTVVPWPTKDKFGRLEPGDKYDTRVIIRINVNPLTSDTPELYPDNIFTDRKYDMTLRYSDIYINEYNMPDNRMATEFFDARIRFARKHDAICGEPENVYVDILKKMNVYLGERLTMSAIRDAEDNLVAAFNTMDMLLNKWDWARRSILLYNKDPQLKYKEAYKEAANTMDT